MPALVTNGIPIFTDIDGDPLEDGYIYIGKAGLNPLSDPLQAYWDAELTIPAANIRTKGGAASNNGSPSRLYVATNYSILVQDKKQRTVYNVLNSVDYYNSPSGDLISQTDTIATLREIVPVDEGFSIKCKGYYNVGDTDMPTHFWSQGSTATDNGGSVIKPTSIDPADPGRYLLPTSLTEIYAEWFGVKYDGSDETTEVKNFLESGYPVLKFNGKECAVDGDTIDITLTQDLRIEGSGTIIKCLAASETQRVLYFITEGYKLDITDLTVDADNKSFQCLRIQNESVATLNDVTLTNVTALNAYRSSQAFLGGDGIFVRGGYRKVLMNNPKVVSVKLATGAGIPGSEGVSGITVVQNFAQTLMPRHVEINNPYVESIFTEDLGYTDDQDGMKLFGITGSPIEQGSCVVNGGVFKNCFGRSIKFQRPDGIVKNSTFIRDNGFGGGNTEIDFQRGGGTVRDIRCEYDTYHPGTVVNSYQNTTNKTFQFLVDGVDVIVENVTMTQVIQRFGVATSDVPTPITLKNIRVIGTVSRIFRYLSVNDSDGTLEQAILENIFFENADHLAQVYGNNTGKSVKMFIKNIVTTGATVRKVDEGDFSNAVTVELYEEDIRGFLADDGGITSRINPLLYGNTEGTYIAELTPDSGTVTLNSSEETLSYTKKGRIVTIRGKIRVLSVSAPTGALKLNLPFPTNDILSTEYWQRSVVVLSGSVSKNSNDFALANNTTDFNDINIFDISGSTETSATAAQMQNNASLYVDYSYIV